MAKLLFWWSLFMITFPYLVYPLLLWVRCRVRPKTIRKGPIEPFVSLLIVAHNEERWIGRKIENCLELDYPPEKLEIVVVSDGSTDRTDAIIERYRDRGVRYAKPFPQQRGKTACLNAMIPRLRGEIVILADARQRFNREAIRALVENFADPEVGAATGELYLQRSPEAAGSEAAGWYWTYEKWVRRMESHTGSIVGATGAIYAIRKALFCPAIEKALIEDVLIPLDISGRGYRVVVEPDAKAYDRLMSPSDEFRRKVRTNAGSWQLLRYVPWHRHPLAGRVLAHRVLRAATPVFLVILLTVSATFLGKGPLWDLVFWSQCAAYACAVVGVVLSRPRVFRIAWAALAIQMASVVGLWGILTQQNLWRK